MPVQILASSTNMVVMVSVRLVLNTKNSLPFLLRPLICCPVLMKILSFLAAGPPSSRRHTSRPVGIVTNVIWLCRQGKGRGRVKAKAQRRRQGGCWTHCRCSLFDFKAGHDTSVITHHNLGLMKEQKITT